MQSAARGHGTFERHRLCQARERAKSSATRTLGHDEFWVPCHIPGRPLLPGVLMIEAGAQVASFYSRKFEGWKGFIGFGGADDGALSPPRSPGLPDVSRRPEGLGASPAHLLPVQGLVNGKLVFEAAIVGVQMKSRRIEGGWSAP